MKEINVIGLGTDGIEDLPLKSYRRITSGDVNILRTARIPIVREFDDNDISYETLDEYFENVEKFDEFYNTLEKKLFSKLNYCDRINYCVPGNPLNGDITTRLLIEHASRENIEINIFYGRSFIDKCISLLDLKNFENLNIIDYEKMDDYSIENDMINIIPQIENEDIAGEILLKLEESYGLDAYIYFIDVLTNKIQKIQLLDAKNYKEYSFSTFFCILPIEIKSSMVYNVKNILRLIKHIRGFGGKKEYRKLNLDSYQDRVTTKFEEALSAFKQDELYTLEEKLADTCFELFLYIELINEEGYFNYYDICKKCIDKYK